MERHAGLHSLLWSLEEYDSNCYGHVLRTSKACTVLELCGVDATTFWQGTLLRITAPGPYEYTTALIHAVKGDSSSGRVEEVKVLGCSKSKGTFSKKYKDLERLRTPIAVCDRSDAAAVASAEAVAQQVGLTLHDLKAASTRMQMLRVLANYQKQEQKMQELADDDQSCLDIQTTLNHLDDQVSDLIGLHKQHMQQSGKSSSAKTALAAVFSSTTNRERAQLLTGPAAQVPAAVAAQVGQVRKPQTAAAAAAAAAVQELMALEGTPLSDSIVLAASTTVIETPDPAAELDIPKASRDTGLSGQVKSRPHSWQQQQQDQRAAAEALLTLRNWPAASQPSASGTAPVPSCPLGLLAAAATATPRTAPAETVLQPCATEQQSVQVDTTLQCVPRSAEAPAAAGQCTAVAPRTKCRLCSIDSSTAVWSGTVTWHTADGGQSGTFNACGHLYPPTAAAAAAADESPAQQDASSTNNSSISYWARYKHLPQQLEFTIDTPASKFITELWNRTPPSFQSSSAAAAAAVPTAAGNCSRGSESALSEGWDLAPLVLVPVSKQDARSVAQMMNLLRCGKKSSCRMASSLIQLSNSTNSKTLAGQPHPHPQQHQPVQQQQQLIGHSFVSYNPNGPLMNLLQQQLPEKLRRRWSLSRSAPKTLCAKGLLYDPAHPVCIMTTSWWRRTYPSSSNLSDGGGGSHVLFPSCTSSRIVGADAAADGVISSTAGVSDYEPDPVPGLQTALNVAVQGASMLQRWSDQQRQLLLAAGLQQRTSQHLLQQTSSGPTLHQLIQQITGHATALMSQSAGQPVEEHHYRDLHHQQQQTSQKVLQQQEGPAEYRHGSYSQHQHMEVQEQEEPLQQPQRSQQFPTSDSTLDAGTQPALSQGPDSVQHDQGPKRRWKLQQKQQHPQQHKKLDAPRQAGPISFSVVDQSTHQQELAHRALASAAAIASASTAGPAGKLQAAACDAQHPFVSAADPFSKTADHIADVAGQAHTCQLPAAPAPQDCLAQVDKVCIALAATRVELLQQAGEVAEAALCSSPDSKVAADPTVAGDMAVAKGAAESGLQTAITGAAATAEEQETAQPLAGFLTAACSSVRACTATQLQLAAEAERCPRPAATDTIAAADPLHVAQVPTGSISTVRCRSIDCSKLGSEEGEIVSETRGRTSSAAASPRGPQGRLVVSKFSNRSQSSGKNISRDTSSSRSSRRRKSSSSTSISKARSSSQSSRSKSTSGSSSQSSDRSGGRSTSASSRSRSRSDSRMRNSRSSTSRSRNRRSRTNSRSRDSRSSSRNRNRIARRSHRSSRSRSVSYSSSSRGNWTSRSTSRSTSRRSRSTSKSSSGCTSRSRSGRRRGSRSGSRSATYRSRGTSRRNRKYLSRSYSRSSSGSRSESGSRSASYSSRGRGFSMRGRRCDSCSRSRSNNERGRSYSRLRRSSRSQSNTRSLPSLRQRRCSYTLSDEDGSGLQQAYANRGRPRYRARSSSPPKVVRSPSACAAAADTAALLSRLDLAGLSSTEIDELRSAALLHMFAEAVLYQPPETYTKGQRLCIRGGLLYQLELACEPLSILEAVIPIQLRLPPNLVPRDCSIADFVNSPRCSVLEMDADGAVRVVWRYMHHIRRHALLRRLLQQLLAELRSTRRVGPVALAEVEQLLQLPRYEIIQVYRKMYRQRGRGTGALNFVADNVSGGSETLLQRHQHFFLAATSTLGAGTLGSRAYYKAPGHVGVTRRYGGGRDFGWLDESEVSTAKAQLPPHHPSPAPAAAGPVGMASRAAKPLITNLQADRRSPTGTGGDSCTVSSSSSERGCRVSKRSRSSISSSRSRSKSTKRRRARRLSPSGRYRTQDPSPFSGQYIHDQQQHCLNRGGSPRHAAPVQLPSKLSSVLHSSGLFEGLSSVEVDQARSVALLHVFAARVYKAAESRGSPPLADTPRALTASKVPMADISLPSDLMPECGIRDYISRSRFSLLRMADKNHVEVWPWYMDDLLDHQLPHRLLGELLQKLRSQKQHEGPYLNISHVGTALAESVRYSPLFLYSQLYSKTKEFLMDFVPAASGGSEVLMAVETPGCLVVKLVPAAEAAVAWRWGYVHV